MTNLAQIPTQKTHPCLCACFALLSALLSTLRLHYFFNTQLAVDKMNVYGTLNTII